MSQALEISELIADVREQVQYLRELGVEACDFELTALKVETGASIREIAEPTKSGAISNFNSEISKISNLKSEISNSPATSQAGESRLASLPSLSKRSTATQSPGAVETPKVPGVAPQPAPVETIEQIRADIGKCTRCPLHAGRTQIVHSTGNFQADLMFVGEAPGADEDEQGFPFVGRAGKLLTDIIAAIGFKREEVFIGNINRCRPPFNRAPVPLETATCKPFLLREVAVVRPKVIVVLGNTATQNLLDVKTPISKLRGSFQDYFGVKVMPTFHPAYLLRDPHKKREVWEDMKMVRDYLNSV